MSDTQRTARRRAIMACSTHPERIAIVEVHGHRLCWECYIGRARFERERRTTIEEFYSRPANQVRLF